MTTSDDTIYTIIYSQIEDMIRTVDPDTDDGKQEISKLAKTYAEEINFKITTKSYHDEIAIFIAYIVGAIIGIICGVIFL